MKEQSQIITLENGMILLERVEPLRDNPALNQSRREEKGFEGRFFSYAKFPGYIIGVKY